MRRFFVFFLLNLCLVASVAARQPSAPVQQAAYDLLQAESAALDGEVSIQVDPLANNRLPPCSQLEAFLPPGARAWGRLSVGVRCVAPAAWTVYLAAWVRVAMPYAVTTRTIAPGHLLAADDIRFETGDISALGNGLVLDAEEAIGHIARYGLAANRPLYSRMLRLPQVIRNGHRVAVRFIGSRFSVSTEGRAMNNASVGENVRVQLDNRQIIQGRASADGVVDVGD